MNKRGPYDIENKRDKQFNSRASENEIKLIDNICDKRKKLGKSDHSRMDVIMLAIKFADGQIPNF